MHADLEDHGFTAVTHRPEGDLEVLERRGAQGGDRHPLAGVGDERHWAQSAQAVVAPAKGEEGPGGPASVGGLRRHHLMEPQREAPHRDLGAG